MQALAQIFREWVEFAVGVKLNGPPGGVHGDKAVLATRDMLLKVGAQASADVVIKQVVEQSHEFRAGHLTPSPFFLRK
jgi:hypothetical protein